MDLVSLAVFGIAVVGLGSAATVLIAKWLPRSALQRAAENGRFVGLGEAPPVTQVTYRPKVRKEALNVVRTSN